MKNLRKKLIAILSIAVMAIALIYSTNVSNGSNSDLDLASLLQVNTANAECNAATFDYYCYSGNTCVLTCAGVRSTGYGWSNTP